MCPCWQWTVFVHGKQKDIPFISIASRWSGWPLSPVNHYDCRTFLPCTPGIRLKFYNLLWFVVACAWLILSYLLLLIHWHWSNLTIAPMPVEQPWRTWLINIMKGLITKHIWSNQSQSQPCAYYVVEMASVGITLPLGRQGLVCHLLSIPCLVMA